VRRTVIIPAGPPPAITTVVDSTAPSPDSTAPIGSNANLHAGSAVGHQKTPGRCRPTNEPDNPDRRAGDAPAQRVYLGGVQRFSVVLELSGAAGIVSDRARVPRLPVEGKLHVLTAGAYHFRRRHAIPADRKSIRLHLRLAAQDRRAALVFKFRRIRTQNSRSIIRSHARTRNVSQVRPTVWWRERTDEQQSHPADLASCCHL